MVRRKLIRGKIKYSLYADKATGKDLFIRLIFGDSNPAFELTRVYDVSKDLGLPKLTFLSSEDSVITTKRRFVKKIGEGYAFSQEYVEFLQARYFYFKKDIVEDHIKREMVKCRTMTQIREFFDKWRWYF